MERVVADLALLAGLRSSPDVAQRIGSAANSNQAIAAQEIEKFALFLGASPGELIELDHLTIDLLGADSAESDLMKLGDLALAGKMEELLDELARMPHGGGEAIPALRALQRRLLMIAPLRARVERGERSDAVMASMGKALFWKDKPLIQRLLTNWSAARIAEAASRVTALERQLIFSGVDAEAACGETMVTLARAGTRRR